LDIDIRITGQPVKKTSTMIQQALVNIAKGDREKQVKGGLVQ
jgi:hypothetical protein